MGLLNTFEQYQSGVLGSEEALLSLAQKKEANVLLVADSHGNTPRFRTILEQLGPDSDALFFCR